MNVIAIVGSLAAFIIAPAAAARLMGLKGGMGKGALVGLVTLGLLQLIGLVARVLGPLGDLLAMMAFLAGWYQVVRVVHGTDTAHTVVFMFWHLFFVLLAASLLALIVGPSALGWVWPGSGWGSAAG